MEWKLDGARVQVHRRGDDVRIFTRNLNDVTARLPGVVAAVRRMPVADVVLDGEAVGLDDDLRPHRFQDTMSRFGREAGVSGAGLQALLLRRAARTAATSLVDEPLSTRLTVLDEVAGALAVPRRRHREPAKSRRRSLDDALARGHEGVMVKALSSPYDAGRRGGTGARSSRSTPSISWCSAAEWGHGRRPGWLSNLHLGARDPRRTRS